jgi:hypothetical protein
MATEQFPLHKQLFKLARKVYVLQLLMKALHCVGQVQRAQF